MRKEVERQEQEGIEATKAKSLRMAKEEKKRMKFERRTKTKHGEALCSQVPPIAAQTPLTMPKEPTYPSIIWETKEHVENIVEPAIVKVP